MIEKLNTQNQINGQLPETQDLAFPPELVNDWVRSTDEMDIFDKPVTINRGYGEETVVLDDAINLRTRNDEGEVREPVVIFRTEDGTRQQMPAASFLKTGDWVDKYMAFKGQKEGTTLATAAEQPVHNQEEDRHLKRLKWIFAPLVRPNNPIEHPGYDYLFSDDDEVQSRYRKFTEAEDKIRPAQQKYDRYVNDATREHAVLQLKRAVTIDKGLQAIINAQAGRIDISDPLKVVDSLRTDPILRLNAGKYFLDKVNKTVAENSSDMPRRVLINDDKNVSGIHDGRNIRSREYVALLCLSKLDGSFNFDQEDPVTDYDSRGVAKIGQHRYAAEYVLGTPASEYPQVEYLGSLATKLIEKSS